MGFVNISLCVFQVTLFEQRNFAGRRLDLTSECQKLSEKNFPDRCNSVQVESGAWVHDSFVSQDIILTFITVKLMITPHFYSINIVIATLNIFGISFPCPFCQFKPIQICFAFLLWRSCVDGWHMNMRTSVDINTYGTCLTRGSTTALIGGVLRVTTSPLSVLWNKWVNKY